MSKNLPIAHPAEVINISPEALEVANCYLQTPKIDDVADQLGLAPDLVSQILDRREVKSYIDNIFFNLGFNNRFTMRKAMDTILQKKFMEMDEAGVGSSKDIAELMALSHKMTIDLMNAEAALEKARAANIKTQTNIQINDGGSKYGNLIEKLVNGTI